MTIQQKRPTPASLRRLCDRLPHRRRDQGHRQLRESGEAASVV
jgi:hypothetical protein